MTQDEEPSVDIILPVFNAEKYIKKCLDSLINQDYKKFRVLIIDDGSTDSTGGILETCYSNYDFIKIVRRENKGLICTLNELVGMCEAKYIARMDADDICDSSRISTQVSFLQDNPEVSVVGSAINFISEEDTFIKSRNVVHGDVLFAYCSFGNPVCHPTVMFNREIVGEDLRYDNKWPHIEDFALWINLFKNGYKIENIKTPLLNYRITSSGITSNNKKSQWSMEQKLISNLFNNNYCDKYLSYLGKYRESEKTIYMLATLFAYFFFFISEEKLKMSTFIPCALRFSKMLLSIKAKKKVRQI